PPSKPNEAPRQVEDLFEVTIKEVLRRELPEIDDELAKDVGEFGSLKELRAYLKQELERQYAHEAQEQLRHRLMDEVIKANSFEAPAHMVELYLDGLVEAARKRSMRRLDEKALREQLRADAIWWVKWQLIRDQIARAEGIEVSEEEVERAVAEAREQHPGEQVDDRARRRIKHDLLEQKVLDLIARHAKIKERKVKHRERASVPLVVTPDEA
ncbi:MAG: hypothetical protein ONB15_13270, partial [candidate division KSB1 bacterium]|nr:hypothetical protein [candidate division KSB1 bacterium]